MKTIVVSWKANKVIKCISRVLAKTGSVCTYLSRTLYVSENALEIEKRFAAWHRDKGDKTLRLDYDLNEHSLVFDLGGYEGQWASDIFAKYCCAVYVFEPVPDYAAKIRRRFENNPKVRVFAFGLADKDQKRRIAVDQFASSIFKEAPAMQDIDLVSARDFVRESGVGQIDLMKINIEGGEYDLLEDLLDYGLVEKITDLQVQFHDFVPDANRRMGRIQERLSQTHSLTYQYPFIFENWRRKSIGAC